MRRNKKILLIDDDEIFLFVAVATLEGTLPKADVRVVQNGEEALSFINKLDVQMVFVDLNMPKMNGWEFLDSIYELGKHEDFPIFIMTSSIDPRDEEKALNHPVKPVYLRKPISKSRILELTKQYKILQKCT